jgi:pimeloyl-ACP methyl ester carboxylesterase
VVTVATTATTSDRQQKLEFITVNGVRIAYTDIGGTGIPLVLVHGSWGSRRNWDPVVPGLSEHFRVVTYDRRGHSDSERPSGQGHFSEDVADLAALIEQLGLTPAWAVGNSAGAVITLKLAAVRPELLRGIVVHEPPMVGLLEDGSPDAAAWEAQETGAEAEVGRRIAAGDHAGAAEYFVDQVAFGPGSWAELPDAMRATMTANAPTYLDELNDPEWKFVDESRLSEYAGPALITSGAQSPPIFRAVEHRLARLLPQAVRTTYAGAGHIPHVTHSAEYLSEVVGFIRSREASQR